MLLFFIVLPTLHAENKLLVVMVLVNFFPFEL